MFNFPIGLTIVSVNIPIILITFYKLKLKFLLMSLKSIIIYSLFLDFLICYFSIFYGNRFILTIFASIFAGIGYSLIFNEGSSSGDTDLIVAFLKRIKPNISFGFFVFLVDIIVIIIYTLLFKDYWAFIYGLIYSFLTSLILDLTTKFLKLFQ